MNEEIINEIQKEMALCYEAIGRRSPESAPIVAASIQDAVNFSNVEQVHEVFKRARDIEAIPSQKTIKECFKNYGEEFLKYAENVANNDRIAYENPRAAWLPADDLKKRVNLMNAIKNYCDAVGGDMAYRYMTTHRSKVDKVGDRKVVKWENPSEVEAFDQPIKKYLRYLYTKYWREIPIAKGYPAEAKLNLGLIPPSIKEFKIMLKAEGVIR